MAGVDECTRILAPPAVETTVAQPVVYAFERYSEELVVMHGAPPLIENDESITETASCIASWPFPPAGEEPESAAAAAAERPSAARAR